MKRFYIPAIIILFTGFIGLGIYTYTKKEINPVEQQNLVATSTVEVVNTQPQYEMWKTVARRITKPEDVPKYNLDKNTGIITRYSGLNDNSFKQYPPCGSVYVDMGDSIMDTLQKETIDDLYRTSNPWFGQADIQFGVNVESLSPEMRQTINKGGSNLIIQRVEDPTADNFCTRWKILGTTSQPIIEHRSAAGALADDFGFARPFKTADLYAYYGQLLVDLPGGQYKGGNIKFDCETILVNAEDSPISSWAWFSSDYKQYLNIDPQKLTPETLAVIRSSTKEHPVKLHIAKAKDTPLKEHTWCEQRRYTIELVK
jgi:hypothetical protein